MLQPEHSSFRYDGGSGGAEISWSHWSARGHWTVLDTDWRDEGQGILLPCCMLGTGWIGPWTRHCMDCIIMLQLRCGRLLQFTDLFSGRWQLRLEYVLCYSWRWKERMFQMSNVIFNTWYLELSSMVKLVTYKSLSKFLSNIIVL